MMVHVRPSMGHGWDGRHGSRRRRIERSHPFFLRALRPARGPSRPSQRAELHEVLAAGTLGSTDLHACFVPEFNVRTLLCLVFLPVVASAAEPVIDIATPMAPPAWALLERELLRANSDACELFYNRYFDDRGWLLC